MTPNLGNQAALNFAPLAELLQQPSFILNSSHFYEVIWLRVNSISHDET